VRLARLPVLVRSGRLVELAGDFRIDDEGAVFIRVPHRTRGCGLRVRYSPLVEERLR
jgi:hypothetical protein